MKVGLAVVFSVWLVGWAVQLYRGSTAFNRAAGEWHAAQMVGDQKRMGQAYKAEVAAHDLTGAAPAWFLLLSR